MRIGGEFMTSGRPHQRPLARDDRHRRLRQRGGRLHLRGLQPVVDHAATRSRGREESWTSSTVDHTDNGCKSPSTLRILHLRPWSAVLFW